MTADVTYAPDRIGYRYGEPDDAYSKGYHRGQDVRQVGAGGGSVVTQVDAIDGGVIVYVGRPNDLLGLTVVIDTGRPVGRYESHSHLADVIVRVGQEVASGERLARNARMDERPGFVDGVHDHVTVTDHPDGAWTTSRPEYDPLPYMEAAYARATGTPSGGNARPFNPPDPGQSPEEDIMLPLRIAYFRGVPGTASDTICVVNVADHTFYRVASTVQADFIKQTAADKVQDIAGVQSFDLIRGFREI